LGLVAEILRDYVRVRRRLRGDDLLTTLEELRGSPPEAHGPQSRYTAARLGRAVGRTLAFLPTDTRCLTQSLVLTSLLARRGIDSALVLGVTTESGFGAHAWLECGGRPVLPSGGAQFGRLVEL
jgi:Transglutaminase-like superfamily